MKRPWQLLAGYLACLVLAFSAMAAVTRHALQLDRAEQEARLRAELEERVGAALWQMDATVSPLLAEELSRPPLDFRAAARMVPLAAPPATETEPAPPASFTGMRFRVGFEDVWESPQCPLPTKGRPAPEDAESRRSAELLERLKTATDFRQLASSLSLSPEMRDRLALDASSPLPNLNDQLSNNLPQSATPQQVDVLGGFPEPASQNANADAAQYEPQQVMRGPRNSAPQSNQSGTDQLPAQQQQVVTNDYLRNQRRERVLQRRQAMQAIVNAQRPDADRWSNVLWIDGQLVLARLAMIDDDTFILGTCLDWQRLKRHLISQVFNELGSVELTPITDNTPISMHRALATLPVQLETPAIEIQMGWTSIRLTLVLAWLFLTFAAIALGALLIGAIRLSERRASFVAAVTHELRSPLTTFRLYTEMLLDGMAPAESRDSYLRTLKAESERLSHLVDNVLQYARLERGKSETSQVDVAVADLMDRIAPRLEERLRQAKMTLHIRFDDAVRETILRTDPTAVEQILYNLADNASKYAAEGKPPSLEVSWKGEANRILCDVRDHGPGISLPAQRSLFQPFSKSVHEAAETAPGVGLGLALSHRLARQLGGALRAIATEPPENGAWFRLELPAESR